MGRILAYVDAVPGRLYPLVPTLLELQRRGHVVTGPLRGRRCRAVAGRGPRRASPSHPRSNDSRPTTGRREPRSRRSSVVSASSGNAPPPSIAIFDARSATSTRTRCSSTRAPGARPSRPNSPGFPGRTPSCRPSPCRPAMPRRSAWASDRGAMRSVACATRRSDDSRSSRSSVSSRAGRTRSARRLGLGPVRSINDVYLAAPTRPRLHRRAVRVSAVRLVTQAAARGAGSLGAARRERRPGWTRSIARSSWSRVRRCSRTTERSWRWPPKPSPGAVRGHHHDGRGRCLDRQPAAERPRRSLRPPHAGPRARRVRRLPCRHGHHPEGARPWRTGRGRAVRA